MGGWVGGWGEAETASGGRNHHLGEGVAFRLGVSMSFVASRRSHFKNVRFHTPPPQEAQVTGRFDKVRAGGKVKEARGGFYRFLEEVHEQNRKVVQSTVPSLLGE